MSVQFGRVVRWAMIPAIVVTAWPWLKAADPVSPNRDSLDWQIPNPALLKAEEQIPIRFVTASQNPKAWAELKEFWNEVTESNPGASPSKAIHVKVPLGLNQAPPVPAENPLTLGKWKLGKELYFDPIISANSLVACSSCHDPDRGFTDQKPVSTGIFGKKGGVNAPTVINSAYSPLQFWDGRAISLEDQAQGPPQNPVEMHDGNGHAWDLLVQRVRKSPEYQGKFEAVFGSLATRDNIAKAIAAYERTVLSGNSIVDRAEKAMHKRLEADENAKPELKASDFETALRAAFVNKDEYALKALLLDPAKDESKIPMVAQSLAHGRELFNNKARCNSCHVGENYTDNQFHNLGVGVKEGVIPPEGRGRFDSLPTGHKNFELMGAFKTPSLRALLSTGPYMHDGSEKTLEDVIELYDRGGNVNEFLDGKMRDYEAEQAVLTGKSPLKAQRFGPSGKPVVPLNLHLTTDEKRDLVLFLRALQGDPVAPIVATPPH